jgi:hypothetical protein
MKPESKPRRTWKPTGLAAGILLATCLVLSPGCGTETPKPPVSPATTAVAPSTPSRVKAKVKRNVEAYDDLRERRAKKRLAAQTPG